MCRARITFKGDYIGFDIKLGKGYTANIVYLVLRALPPSTNKMRANKRTKQSFRMRNHTLDIVLRKRENINPPTDLDEWPAAPHDIATNHYVVDTPSEMYT